MAIVHSVPSTFLYNRLNGDAQLAPNGSLGSKGTHNTEIPQSNTAAARDAIYPCVFFSLDVSNRFRLGNGNHILGWPVIFQVIAYGEKKDMAKLESIADRIHLLLHGFNGSISGGGYISNCTGIQPVYRFEPGGEVTFLRVGGFFRILARSSNS